MEEEKKKDEEVMEQEAPATQETVTVTVKEKKIKGKGGLKTAGKIALKLGAGLATALTAVAACVIASDNHRATQAFLDDLSRPEQDSNEEPDV